MITLLDYGAGNVRSLVNALKSLGETVRFVQSPDDILSAAFLGICIGLQALFEKSEEEFGVHGLGFIRGSVRRFAVDLSVPHIGWNGLSIKKPSRIFNDLSILFTPIMWLLKTKMWS